MSTVYAGCLEVLTASSSLDSYKTVEFCLDQHLERF